MIQIWVVLILAPIVSALRERITHASDCDLFEVSVPIVVDLLPRLWGPSPIPLEHLLQADRHVGLLRANPRLELTIPQVDLARYQPAPPDLLRQRPGRCPSPPRRRAAKPATRVCGYQVPQKRRQVSKEAQSIRAAQAKASQGDMAGT